MMFYFGAPQPVNERNNLALREPDPLDASEFLDSDLAEHVRVATPIDLTNLLLMQLIRDIGKLRNGE